LTKLLLPTLLPTTVNARHWRGSEAPPMLLSTGLAADHPAATQPCFAAAGAGVRAETLWASGAAPGMGREPRAGQPMVLGALVLLW